MIVEFKNVTKVYEDPFNKKNSKKAVENISFGLISGSTLGLIGNSGCGKSTIAKMLLRLEKPSSGDILYNGRSILNGHSQYKKQLCRDIQVVFQHPEVSLNPNMTVLQNLLEPIRIHKLYSQEEALGKIEEKFRLTGLNTNILSRYPSSISGGEAQRAMICRILLMNTKVLILDEPTSMLDVSIQAQIMELLMELKEKEKLTYIFITHDLELAQYFCENLVIMQEGKIIESGPCGEILSNPKDAFTRELVRVYKSLKVQ